jgi:hypothetical protein
MIDLATLRKGDVLRFDDGTLLVVTDLADERDALRGWQPGLPLYWRTAVVEGDQGRLTYLGNVLAELQEIASAEPPAQAHYIHDLVVRFQGFLA